MPEIESSLALLAGTGANVDVGPGVMVGLGSGVGEKVGLGIAVDVGGGSVGVGKTDCIGTGVGPDEQETKYNAMKNRIRPLA